MEEDEKYQMEDVRGWDEMGTKKDIEYWQEGRKGISVIFPNSKNAF